MNSELASALQAHHSDAFGWALHCCHGERARAEEVLQNAYLKVVSGKAAPSENGVLKTWWFGVIRFTAMEDLRRSQFRASFLGRLIQQLVIFPTTTSAPTPDAAMADQEDHHALKALLAELSPRQSEVLHLVFYQELTLREAAEVMGISIGSARQHYERGKQRLRELYQPETASHQS
jgi:RNA polymerase sigma factor (sigma-70 family)